MFQPGTYIQRRAALKKGCTSGIAIFLANNNASMNYPANTYRYRQDSSFIYFFKHQLPKMAAIIDFDNGTETLYADDYSMDDIIWVGPQPTVAEFGAQIGIDTTSPYAHFEAAIAEALKAGRTVHYLPPYRDDNRILLSKLTGIALDNVRAQASLELINAVVALRNTKQPEEVAEMEKACNLGVEMHTAVMRNCKVGKTERELAGLAEGIALSYGNGVSFPIILSQNGQTLHNHDHSQTLQAGRLLLVDMGAELCNGYSSDYTRTLPVSGKFTPKQREMYEIVLKANLESIKMARPGITYWEVHLHATTTLVQGLIQLGLMKGNAAEAAKQGAHALFMPHGLGHMLGLDVHDMEDLGQINVGYDQNTRPSTIFGHASLRCGRELKEGYVLTVEPGIYFIPELIAKWEHEGKFAEYINYGKVREYLDFGGIRLEDDILITANGCRVLGKPLPKTVAEIEALMA